MHKVLVTGGSGYIGAMLVRAYALRDDVEAVLSLDKEAPVSLHEGLSKVAALQANLADDTWQEEVKKFAPDIVIHAAWQIRELYGKRDLQWRWNIGGSDKLFMLISQIPSVKRLIHFSSVASYGAYPDNTLDYRFTEKDPLRKTDYLYAEEKRISEVHLQDIMKGSDIQVFVVRPASISGPRGRFMNIKFGLQSALSGKLRKTPVQRIVSALLSFVPITPTWCRQFVHEDDVVGIITALSFSPIESQYEVFNLCPPGPVVTGKDMARAVGKKAVVIHPRVIQMVFFLAWHLSFGRIPTSRGGWKTYSYPIAVDGSKVTNMLGYTYKYGPLASFTEFSGEYTALITK